MTCTGSEPMVVVFKFYFDMLCRTLLTPSQSLEVQRISSYLCMQWVKCNCNFKITAISKVCKMCHTFLFQGLQDHVTVFGSSSGKILTLFVLLFFYHIKKHFKHEEEANALTLPLDQPIRSSIFWPNLESSLLQVLFRGSTDHFCFLRAEITTAAALLHNSLPLNADISTRLKSHVNYR